MALPKYIFLFLLVSIRAFSALGQTGISVTPPRVYFEINPGESRREQITVTNVSKSHRLDLAISLNDWLYSREGDNIIVQADTLPTSSAAWISFEGDSYFSLAPGERKDIGVVVNRPTSASTEDVYTTMLFVTQLNPIDDIDSKGAQIKVAIRSGIKLFVRSNRPRNVMLNIHNGYYDTEHKRLGIEFINEGNVWANGDIKTELLNNRTGEIRRLENTVFYTMPKDDRLQFIPLPENLPIGSYTATVILDAGNNTIEAAEIEFEHE